MRVLELSLRNYRIFEEVDLELPARVIGIFGVNGAGKSTLMESIAFACYGVDAARTKKQEIRTHGVLTDCEVRLVFEHAGQPYEVRRTISGKGHTPGGRAVRRRHDRSRPGPPRSTPRSAASSTWTCRSSAPRSTPSRSSSTRSPT